MSEWIVQKDSDREGTMHKNRYTFSIQNRYVILKYLNGQSKNRWLTYGQPFSFRLTGTHQQAN
jgi:hypothetical protein